LAARLGFPLTAAALVTGVLTANGGAVFNESGADVDFRVESDTDANALFVQGSDGFVGIGTSSPQEQIHSYAGGSNALRVSGGANNNKKVEIGYDNTNGPYIKAGSSGETGLQFYVDNTSLAATIDSTGRVGIGRTPTISNSKLEVGGADDVSLINVEASGVTGGMGIGSTGLQFFHGSTARMTIDSTGAVTMPYQPAFLAQPASTQADISTGTAITVVFGTEVFDQNTDFASNTFTAPVTGKYQLSYSLYLEAIDTAASYYEIWLQTSNRIYASVIDPNFVSNLNYLTLTQSVLADMDVGDTAYVTIRQQLGTAQTDISVASFFSGYLVA
jgi:hypothetical protein